MNQQFLVQLQSCTQTLMRVLNLLAQRDAEIRSLEMHSGNCRSWIAIDVAGLSFQDAQIVVAKMRSIVGVATVDLVDVGECPQLQLRRIS